MLLLAIEINLDDFFDVKIVVFTIIAFLFSVIVTVILVFSIRPINKKARLAKNRQPEKLNLTYLRLIIYILGEFIAFVADIFLIIFNPWYNAPWATITVFTAIVSYKLVYVLFKDFRDLGFNAEGLKDSLRVTSKAITQRSFEPLGEFLDEDDTDNMNKEENMTKRVKYKKKTLRSKFPMFLFFFLTFFFIGCGILNKDKKEEKSILIEKANIKPNQKIRSAFTAEDLVSKTNKEKELSRKIQRVKSTNSNKVVVSEFTETETKTETETETETEIEGPKAPLNDTIIIRMWKIKKATIVIKNE